MLVVPLPVSIAQDVSVSTGWISGNDDTSAMAVAPPLKYMPDSLLGFWSVPDCTESYMVLVNSRHFILMATEDRPFILPLTGVFRGTDFFYITSAGFNFAAQSTNDGILNLSLYSRKGMFSGDMTSWAEYSPVSVMSYAHCEEHFIDWPSLNDNSISAFYILDAIYKNCINQPFEQNIICHGIAFNEADSNDDRTLDYRELALVFRKSAYLYASIAHIDFNQFFPGDTAITGPEFAAEMIELLDKDESKSLSVREIVENWSKNRQAIQETPNGKVFIKHIENIVTFMERDPVTLAANTNLTCNAVVTETGILTDPRDRDRPAPDSDPDPAPAALTDQ